MDSPFFEGKRACCFTGHRPVGLPREESGAMVLLRLLLMRTVQEAAAAGVVTFLCGGAEGFDTLAAEAVLTAKDAYPAVRLVLALPCRHFLSTGRGRSEQLRAEAILHAADEIVCASETELSARTLKARDRYLVEQADCCVAYLKKSAGGTLYTVNYALDREIPVRNLVKEMQC